MAFDKHHSDPLTLFIKKIFRKVYTFQLTSDKTAKDKEVNRKNSNPRMSKNQRNLNKRMKQLEEAKDKKVQLKKKIDEAAAKVNFSRNSLAL